MSHHLLESTVCAYGITGRLQLAIDWAQGFGLDPESILFFFLNTGTSTSRELDAKICCL